MLNQIRSCKGELSSWNKKTFKNAAKEIRRLKEDLATILNSAEDQIDWNRANSLRAKIRTLWDQEEKFWC